jgi:hypothetical protein
VANPRITRLTLIPYTGTDDSLRRYRLARLDEVALASPPDPSAVERRPATPGEAPAQTEGEPEDPDASP